MSSLKYWVWLSEVEGVGPVTAARLIGKFKTVDMVYLAEAHSYTDVEGITAFEIKQLMKKDLGKANRILASCDETGCRVITQQDADYPEYLKNIYDPPVVLYVKGTLPRVDEDPVISVVGTRNCTPYGLTAAESIGYKLSKHGFIVATGLARGIDSAATLGALRGGNPVIGVIGTGIDVIYPPENRSLYEDVAGNGAIISEYPPGTQPAKLNFPMRNRILSGLSDGVTVIEAPRSSGALITAGRALEEGRDIFVLPGNVDAVTCEGSNALMRNSVATPIISANDIIKHYMDRYPGKILRIEEGDDYFLDDIDTGIIKKVIDNDSKVDYIDNGKKHWTPDKIIAKLDGDEKLVAETLGTRTLHVDEITIRSGLQTQQVLTALTMLEISGFVSGESKYYSLTESA